MDLGTVRPGTTIYIPFHTFDSNDPSASVTLTGLLASDIEVYKDGSTTQRASDSGYALLDTDGIDFDGVTGIHGFSIDLADNTTAGFWAAGSQYWVVVASVTVDGATINFVAATFRIGYPDAILNTTIATLASQTSFTLTNGPAEDDALNGCVVCIHDVASAVQLGFAVISDYTGATKTVTLTAGVSFTAAVTDNIAIFPPVNSRWAGAALDTAQTGDSFARLGAPAGASVSADIAAIEAQTDDIGAAGAGLTALAQASVCTEARLSELDAGTPGKAAAEIDLIKTDAAAILVDTGTTLDGRIPAALVSGRMDSSVGAMATDVVTAAAIAADAIGASELAADAATEIADALLDRNMATGTDSGSTTVRTVRQALRAVRNRAAISGGVLTIYKEDDSTASWTGAVTTAAGNPISEIDPAGP